MAPGGVQRDLLLRELGPNRKTLFSLKPAGTEAPVVRLVCRESGRCIVLADADLHARVLVAARTGGVPLEGRPIDIEIPGDTRRLT